MAETQIALPMVSSEEKCPKCGAAIPVDPRYAKWCDKCGWNLRPFIGERPGTKRGELYARMNARFDKQLFASVQREQDLEPRLAGAKVAAYAIATLVHASTLLCAVLCVLLVVQGWPNFIIVGFGLFCGLIAWALRPAPRQLDRQTQIRSVSQAGFPTLHRLAERIAQELGAAPPAAIVIDHVFNSGYSEIGWSRRPVLTLGLPLLTILSPQERVATISNQLAHGANGDANNSLYIDIAVNSLAKWYEFLRPNQVWVTRSPYTPFAMRTASLATIANVITLALSWLPLLALNTLTNLLWHDKQRAEYLADALSARIAGTDAVLAALARLHYSTTIELAVQRAVLDRRKTDLFDDFRQAVAAMPAREIERITRVEDLPQSRTDLSHPPTAFRRALLLKHAVSNPRLVLSAEESAQIDSELATLHGRIQTEMLDAYRDRLN